MLPSSLLEKGWCQKVSAKTYDGRNCKPWDEEAVKWDLVGAAEATLPFNLCDTFLDFIREHLRTKDLFQWNDKENRTVQEVLEATRIVEKIMFGEKEKYPYLETFFHASQAMYAVRLSNAGLTSYGRTLEEAAYGLAELLYARMQELSMKGTLLSYLKTYSFPSNILGGDWKDIHEMKE